MPPGRVTAKEPDWPHEQNCVQRPVDRDVSFQVSHDKRRCQDLCSKDPRGRPVEGWEAVFEVHVRALCNFSRRQGPFDHCEIGLTQKAPPTRTTARSFQFPRALLPCSPGFGSAHGRARAPGHQGWLGTPAHRLWGHCREPLKGPASVSLTSP